MPRSLDRLTRLALLATLAVAPGCSLIVDGSRFLERGDAGGVVPDRDGEIVDRDVGVVRAPPQITTVGLSQYAPIVGETLVAMPGPVYEPNGDRLTFTYRWLRRATPIDGADAKTYVVTAADEGASLAVEVTVSDRDGSSATVRAASATVRPYAPRWRELFPPLGQDIGLQTVFDPTHHRALLFRNGDTWEIAATGSDLHVARLPVASSGLNQDDLLLVLSRPGSSTFHVFDPTQADQLFELDASVRGGESWRARYTDGVGPGELAMHVSFYDPATSRFFLVTGMLVEAGFATSARALFVPEGDGAPVWSTPSLEGDPLPPLVAAAVAADPTTPGVYYVFGGFTTPSEGTGFVPSGGIYRIEVVSTETLRVTQLDDATYFLDTPFVAGAALGLTGTSQILLYGGLASLGDSGPAVPTPARIFDVATQRLADAGLGAPTRPLTFATFSPDPMVPGAWLAASQGDLDGDDVSWTIERISGDGSSLRVDPIAHTEIPASISNELGRIASVDRDESRRIEILDGRGEAMGPLWTLDLTTLTWGRIETTGTGPAARTGLVADTSHTVDTMSRAPTPYRLVLAGGETRDGPLASMDAWWWNDERGDAPRWVELPLSTDPRSPVPTMRTGSVATGSWCGDSMLMLIGGEGADGTLVDDAALLSCTFDRRSCTWALSSVPIPHRSYAAAFQSSAYDGTLKAYVFGGRDDVGGSNGMFALPLCYGEIQPPLEVTTTGAPTPRFGHSFTGLGGANESVVDAIAFGGALDPPDPEIHLFHLTSATTGVWSVVPPVADEPRPDSRHGHLAIWDDLGERLLILGGADRRDIWEFRFRPSAAP